MSVGEPHTRLSGIKQDLLDFKDEINSVLVNIKSEMQSNFDDINNRLNVIENNINPLGTCVASGQQNFKTLLLW